MLRGVMPRRPGKTGRHEGARLTARAIAAPVGPSKDRKVSAKTLANSASAKAPKKAASTAGRSTASKLEPQQLEADIRSTGFFRNKSKSVVGAARRVVSEYGGKVPQTMEDLLTLPGVARKTANVVLGTWFKKAEGVVVDTHVHRISRRLELTKNDDPKKIEQDLMAVIPRERWILFSHQVIWHGRKLCFARSPNCVDCLLENTCHAEDKTWSTVEKHKGARA
jgi:endonuclease III